MNDLQKRENYNHEKYTISDELFHTKKRRKRDKKEIVGLITAIYCLSNKIFSIFYSFICLHCVITGRSYHTDNYSDINSVFIIFITLCLILIYLIYRSKTTKMFNLMNRLARC